MRAVVYQGPFKVNVERVPDPKLEQPTDVIVKITSTCICGSDLHMYKGRTAAAPALVFGHENMGTVEEVGKAVPSIKKADRVSMPFSVACGFCKNCLASFTGFCLTVNPGFAGGAYGYVAMGPYVGGQAEYLRVLYADFNCLPLPGKSEHEFEKDFSLLADIFCTGYHGAYLAEVSPGDTVAVFGAGPVGIMAALSCIIRGAAEVYVVDHVPERLAVAEKIGCFPINFDQGDAVKQIRDKRHGEGVDKGIDPVGYQACAPKTGQELKEVPNAVLDALTQVVNPCGILAIPGLYVPSDPGGVDAHAQKGYLLMPFGKIFEKGLTLRTGQCNVKKDNRHLRDLIVRGRAKPSVVVSNVLSLDQAPMAYDKFDKRVEGYTKVILKPSA